MSTSPQGLPFYGAMAEDDVLSIHPNSSDPSDPNHSDSLLYSLALLKDKVHQVESLVAFFTSSTGTQPNSATSIAVASLSTLIQDIIVTASAMMFTSQQMALGNITPGHDHHHKLLISHDSVNGGRGRGEEERISHGFYTGPTAASLDYTNWYANNVVHGSFDSSSLQSFNDAGHCNCNKEIIEEGRTSVLSSWVDKKANTSNTKTSTDDQYDIIELEAADLLAKYTHYCRVCQKGFKRDANLRMHMRAHGEEYKSRAALSKPTPSNANNSSSCNSNDESNETYDNDNRKVTRKYSCPQEGCRWNRRHPKFQPLKSMICVKNHYRRSHCPKMYVCRRCTRKHFSVLSDLRTHEKHCGDIRWRCSCGTTFSRKDKLMSHVSLFAGHSPMILSVAGKDDELKIKQLGH